MCSRQCFGNHLTEDVMVFLSSKKVKCLAVECVFICAVSICILVLLPGQQYPGLLQMKCYTASSPGTTLNNRQNIPSVQYHKMLRSYLHRKMYKCVCLLLTDHITDKNKSVLHTVHMSTQLGTLFQLSKNRGH